MSSHGRSVTPSRRYGEIMGSILSQGSPELEQKVESPSSAEAKRKFRERRKKNERCLKRSSVPEQRQDASPLRRQNEKRNGGRPPTPDRNRQSRSPRSSMPIGSETSQHDRKGSNASSDFKTSSTEPKVKGISIRALSKSPSRRKSSEIRAAAIEDKEEHSASNSTEKSNSSSGLPTILKTGYETSPNSTPKGSQSKLGKDSLTAGDDKHNKSGVSFFPNDDVQMRKIVQAQNDQIRFYGCRLKEKSNDIEQLRFELQKSKLNEAKLQLDLETHDLKYSMYDDYRRAVDRNRLDEKSEGENQSERDLAESTFSNTCEAFAKLDRLDRLFEQSNAEAARRYSLLEEEYEKAKSMIRELEKGKAEETEVVRDTDGMVLGFLEERIKILEFENSRHLIEIEKQKKELVDIRSKSKGAPENDATKVGMTNLEKQTLTNKIIALETEIGFTSGQIDNKTRTRRYQTLEKNLNEYVVEIMGLEDQLKAKEKVVLGLKEKELARNLDFMLKSTSKWYEKSNRGYSTKDSAKSATKVIGESMSSDGLRGLEFTSDRSINGDTMNGTGEKSKSTHTTAGKHIEAVSAHISNNIGGKRNGSRKYNAERGVSSSSQRIAMLRKRLEALASDHSSVCTDETHRSIKTTPF